jgi:prepilin-type N-terminal cleavage/methylation domain-containing protein
MKHKPRVASLAAAALELGHGTRRPGRGAVMSAAIPRVASLAAAALELGHGTRRPGRGAVMSAARQHAPTSRRGPERPRVMPPALTLMPRAFTLIELLVVITVIALLLGITLPALGTARETSRRVKCLANLRGIGQGVALYINDSQGILPRVRALHVPGAPPNDISLLDLLADYLDAAVPRVDEADPDSFISSDPFTCPSDRWGSLPIPDPPPAGPPDPRPIWKQVGTSYEYTAGLYMDVAEVGLSVDRPAFGVTKALDNNRNWAIIQDQAEWHRLRTAGLKQNAVFWPDFRVDWTSRPSAAEFNRFAADVLRFGGRRP